MPRKPAITLNKVPKSKHFLRCPCCGRNCADRNRFARGALGHLLQALKSEFVGRGGGTNGGAVIWTRRPMTREELEFVGRATTVAVKNINEQLGGDLAPAVYPEDILASIESVNELSEIGHDWVVEADEEAARRRQLLEDELKRRGRGSNVNV